MKKILIFVILATILYSCQSGKVVYNIGNGWKPAPNTSQMTGIKIETK